MQRYFKIQFDYHLSNFVFWKIYTIYCLWTRCSTPIQFCAVGSSANSLQNKETQHVNIVLQCKCQYVEQPNMKGNHALIEWSALKCFHVLNWFFLPKPGFWEFIWIFSGSNQLKINICHILNPNPTQKIPLNPDHQDLFNNTKMHISIPPKISVSAMT
jgi:hypothetical protein